MSSSIRPRGVASWTEDGDFFMTFFYFSPAANATAYYPLSGTNNSTGTETKVSVPFPFRAMLRNVTVNCNTNTLDAGNLTFTVRDNAADIDGTSIQFAFTATGTTSSGTLAATIAPGDLINYKIQTGGTTGACQVTGFCVWQRVRN